MGTLKMFILQLVVATNSTVATMQNIPINDSDIEATKIVVMMELADKMDESYNSNEHKKYRKVSKIDPEIFYFIEYYHGKILNVDLKEKEIVKIDLQTPKGRVITINTF